jgi:hypothetical protein
MLDKMLSLNISITPQDESLATKDAIRSLKLGKRRCFAERARDSKIIAFPQPFALPIAASN